MLWWNEWRFINDQNTLSIFPLNFENFNWGRNWKHTQTPKDISHRYSISPSRQLLQKLQTFQSTLLRLITKLSWYVTNKTLHSDFRHKELYKQICIGDVDSADMFMNMRRPKSRWIRDFLPQLTTFTESSQRVLLGTFFSHACHVRRSGLLIKSLKI